MGLEGINLKSPQEMCDSANQIDSGLHEKEKLRFSFYAYWFKLYDRVSAKISLIFRR